MLVVVGFVGIAGVRGGGEVRVVCDVVVSFVRFGEILRGVGRGGGGLGCSVVVLVGVVVVAGSAVVVVFESACLR